MPKIFAETGHGLTDLVIDATEFIFQSASNFELNSLMFSNGGGILFSDILPGSISTSKINEECGAVYLVEQEHEIVSDRAFSIQQLCASRGITLNRPKQKENDQFMEVDIANNFDIAATRTMSNDL